MATVLHLLKGGDHALALATIARQVEAGDRVTVVLLDKAAPPSLPAGTSVRRLHRDLSYDQLLDLVFAAAHVITW